MRTGHPGVLMEKPVFLRIPEVFRKLNKSYVELKNQEAAAEEEVLFPVMVLSEGCSFFVPVEPAALYFLPKYCVFLNLRKGFFFGCRIVRNYCFLKCIKFLLATEPGFF